MRSVEIPEVDFQTGAVASVRFATYPWLIVLNQDCDLLNDRLARTGQGRNQDDPPVKRHNILRSILLCPGFPPDEVYLGSYLPDAPRRGSTESRGIESNQMDRFHYLAAAPPVDEGIVIDFKLSLSAPSTYLEWWMQQHPISAVAVLNSPWRDRLTQRFLSYFGRIAEPEE